MSEAWLALSIMCVWESSVAYEVQDVRDYWSDNFFDSDKINVLIAYLCTALKNFIFQSLTCFHTTLFTIFMLHACA